MNLSIDKHNWKKVCLGDVAFEYSKRINNPNESDYDRFVGSNNIGQWDFRIKSWESTDSVTSAMKLFEPNDYLLVRRSLYASDFRERAPRADFYGVCSGDILTIKENPDFLSDGFLIGVLNSPDLWKYVVANASGSITRRIKWKDLANYQFLLPPKDQQARLASLLWALDVVMEREREMLGGLERTYQVLVDNLFTINNPNWSYIPLSKISKINNKSLGSSTESNFRFKYLDIASIIEPKIIGDLEWMNFEESPSRARRVVSDNSIVLSLVRPYHKSFVIIEDSSNIIASTGTGVIDVFDKHNPHFIFHQFFSSRFSKFYEIRMRGANYPSITADDLKEFLIAIPENMNIEDIEAEKLKNFDNSILKIKTKLQTSLSMQKSIINQIF